jgi:hypothetical protein
VVGQFGFHTTGLSTGVIPKARVFTSGPRDLPARFCLQDQN